MYIVVTDLINGMQYFYTEVKTVQFNSAFTTIIFKDGSKLNFHCMIYKVELY